MGAGDYDYDYDYETRVGATHVIRTILTSPDRPISACSYSYSSSLPMPPSSHLHFDHEKLVAYQRSIQFVAWASKLLEELPPKLAVSDQLDRASTSVPLNLAEGNGK